MPGAYEGGGGKEHARGQKDLIENCSMKFARIVFQPQNTLLGI